MHSQYMYLNIKHVNHAEIGVKDLCYTSNHTMSFVQCSSLLVGGGREILVDFQIVLVSSNYDMQVLREASLHSFLICHLLVLSAWMDFALKQSLLVSEVGWLFEYILMHSIINSQRQSLKNVIPIARVKKSMPLLQPNPQQSRTVFCTSHTSFSIYTL